MALRMHPMDQIYQRYIHEPANPAGAEYGENHRVYENTINCDTGEARRADTPHRS